MDNDRQKRIAARAYEMWEAAGRPEGTSDQDWSAAEQEDIAQAGGANDGPEIEAQYGKGKTLPTTAGEQPVADLVPAASPSEAGPKRTQKQAGQDLHKP